MSGHRSPRERSKGPALGGPAGAPSTAAAATRGGRATRLVVAQSAQGTRLDHFIAAHAGISAAAARRLIATGAVRLGGLQRAVKGVTVAAGDVVELADVLAPASAGRVSPDETVGVAVLFEDEHLVAVSKPAGVPSHPLAPGERGTAANGIVALFPNCADASPDPREGGLAHRLDTGTSGVLIAARSRSVWSMLRSALSADDCEKRYLCEVWGAPPATGRVDGEIGRSGRRGAVVRVGGGGRRPRPAQTTWTVIGRGEQTALLEARLHAGRAHQVRAHLASAGFPIVGDDRYGASTEQHRLDLHLHAVAVRLRHPVTGAPLLIEAPPPPWARLELFRSIG